MTATAKQETKVLKISMYSCFICVFLEFLVSIFSGSQSVLMDSVYDASEVVMIFASMKLVPLLYKPESEKRPYGYAQVESILVLVKSIMMIAVTIGLVVNNLQIIFSGGNLVKYDLVAYFQLFLSFISIIVIVLLKKKNENLQSPIINVEINGWIIDAVSSIGMSIAFFTPMFFDNNFVTIITPYIDQITAIFLSFFILPIPVKVLWTGFRDIFLFAPEPDTMNLIKSQTHDILLSNGLHGITYDVIRTGRKLWICIYFKPKDDTISVLRVSRIQKDLEAKLEKEFNDIYVELLPDID